MRAAAAALLVGLVFALAGCSSDGKQVTARGSDAARLVPPDALAFASVDGDLDSKEWETVTDAIGPIALDGDIPPAIGDQLNLAVLGKDEVIALVHSKDEQKLRKVAEGFDTEDEHYSVQKIGGWHVVADSPDAFAAVRAAESGRSLADVAEFKRAMDAVSGDSLVTAYADGTRLDDVPDELGALFRVVNAGDWIGARLSTENDAARVTVRTDAPARTYRPRLLQDVPSGAMLALSFKDADQLLARIDAEPSLRKALGEYRLLLTELTPALRGEGVLYVAPGLIVPTIGLEVASPTQGQAANALLKVAARVGMETNTALTLNVLRRPGRVLLTNGATWPRSAGGRLVDDEAFKDALAAADAPADLTWLAYADIAKLRPIVQTLSQLAGGKPPRPEEQRRFERLKTLVAFGTSSGSTSRLELRLTIR